MLGAHCRREQKRSRVGDAAPGNVRCRTVHRLENRKVVAHIRRRRQPQPTNQSCADVTEDVADKVFRDDDIKARRVGHQLHCHSIRIGKIECDLRILLRNLLNCPANHTRRVSQDIRLVRHRHHRSGLRIGVRRLPRESQLGRLSRKAVPRKGCRHAQRNRNFATLIDGAGHRRVLPHLCPQVVVRGVGRGVVRRKEIVVAVEALGVFADDGEVGSRAGQGDRADIGEEVEALTQLENRGAVSQAGTAQMRC